MATVSFENFHRVQNLEFDILKLKEELNKVLKQSEQRLTNLGPKTEPKTENQTAKDNAVALNFLLATKEAAYLD